MITLSASLARMPKAPQSTRRMATPAVFGSSSRRAPRSASSEDWDEESDERLRHREQGTYRTLCVRLCDGYYFPVSFSATRERFARDAQVCAQACGAEARLFVHRNPGADTDDMVDLQGRPYGQLPAAFLYRREYVAACRCQPNPWAQEARERHRLYALAAAKRKGSKQAAQELEALQAKMRQASPQRVARQPHEEGVKQPGSVVVAPARMSLGGRRPEDNSPRRNRATRAGDDEPDWRRRVFQGG
jgi:hypothetical protein